MSKEGWYRNDEQAGWWKDYNDKGELLFEGNYEHSVKNGYFKYYYNNKLESEGMYSTNLKKGDWKYYDTTGLLKNIVLYE